MMADFDYDTDVTFLPASMDFGIVTNTMISTSNLTGHTKRIEVPGARWRARLSYQDMTKDDARKLMAFLVLLKGPVNRAILRDWSLPVNQGISTAGKSISGFPSGANSFTLAGGGTFTVGDYFSIDTTNYGRELKMVTGHPGDVNFEPALRGPITYSEYEDLSLETVDPSGKFILTSDDQVYWNARGKIGITSMDVEFIEGY